MAAGIFRLVRLASFVNLRPRAEEGVDSLIRSISASSFVGLAFSCTCSEVGWDLCAASVR